MDYLQQHKDTLIPEFRQVWEAAGFKTSGTWEEVFGKGAATDEIFMAWNYARYIGRVAEAGKAEYPLPMYVNAALYGFARGGHPQSARAAAPCPVMDVWRAGAPQIDMLSPDIYNDDFVVMTARKYTPDPGTRCSYPRPPGARKARPERSTPSDATMPSVTRPWGSTG
jgi:hypothetical protein